MKWDEIRRQTAERLSSVRVTNEPFPHVFIRDVFPEPFFQALRANLPADESLEATDPKRSSNQYAANRRKFAIDPAHLASLPEGPREFWTEARRWLGGREFTQAVLARFAAGIARRYGSRSLDLVNRIEINVDRENYAIPPHTDSPKKMVTMLFYLPADDARADLGTSIYVPKDPTFRSEKPTQYPFEQFDLVASFPYVPNSCLAFLKTDNSFHGRPLVTGENVSRPMMFVSIQHRTPSDTPDM
ncbi:hypothetical protein [Stella sp.]|uniref:hypothetical protein n=1 Tax=Stella sp. TaxID=2912054 RepID=UPI0035AF7B56